MTNDLNTLNGSLQQMIDELETNLQLMGVNATYDSTTGIRGLIAQITDISASVGGIDVVTALSCELSETNIGTGDSVVITGVLEADKDDTTSTNVDLEGYLKNANIGIYVDNTLVDTVLTNENGFYSYTYTPTGFGSKTIQARFNGTGTDYDSAVSSNVTLSVMSFTLTTDKNILSYSDSDTVTLTVQVGDSNNPVSNAEVTFEYLNEYGFGSVIDTDTSDNTGGASVTYDSQGLGDLYIRASTTISGVTYSDTISIEDCWYYNSNTYSSSNSTFNKDLPSGDFSIELDFKPTTRQSSSLYVDFGSDTNNRILFGQLTQAGLNGIQVIKNGSSTNYYFNNNTTLNEWNHLTFKYINGKYIISRSIGDTVYDTETVNDYNISFSKLFHVEGAPNGQLTNIKIKKIYSEPLSLSTTKNILSYTDNDSTTLTATLLDGFDNPVENASIVFKKGTVPVATIQTDSNGEATYTYNSRGVGDLTLSANYESLSESVELEDCWYGNSGANVGSLEIDSEVSCTSNGEYITITKSTNGEKYVKLPVSLTANDDYEFEFEIANTGNVQSMAINWNTESDWAFYSISSQKWGVNSVTISDEVLNIGDNFKVKKQGTTVTFYINNILKHTISNKSYSNHWIGFYTNQNRIQHIKNIKLNNMSDFIRLSSSKNILSYADEDEALLTATVMEDGLPVEDAIVTWKIDNTIIGTSVTDSNGDAVYVYESQGVGDVTFTVECMNLQETYEVQDCVWYNTLTDSSADSNLIRTGVTCSYTSNGLAITNGNWKEIVFGTPITQGMQVEYDITSVGGKYTPKYYGGCFSAYSQGNIGITNYQPNATGHIKLTYQNNTVQCWLDDTLMTDVDSSSTSPTVTTTPLYYKVSTGSDRTFTIKNMKIKPL